MDFPEPEGPHGSHELAPIHRHAHPAQRMDGQGISHISVSLAVDLGQIARLDDVIPCVPSPVSAARFHRCWQLQRPRSSTISAVAVIPVIAHQSLPLSPAIQEEQSLDLRAS